MPGPRVYTVDEVHAILPRVERHLQRMDEIREELRALHIRLHALELIWGEGVKSRSNPDHGEFEHHLGQMKELEDEFERCQHSIGALGGHVKGADPPLVDFYGVREGRLVFLCWRRGEDRIQHWHHVDQGYAQRQQV